MTLKVFLELDKKYNFIKSIMNKKPKHIIYFSSASLYGEDVEFDEPITENEFTFFKQSS